MPTPSSQFSVQRSIELANASCRLVPMHLRKTLDERILFDSSLRDRKKIAAP